MYPLHPRLRKIVCARMIFRIVGSANFLLTLDSPCSLGLLLSRYSLLKDKTEVTAMMHLKSLVPDF